MDITGWDTVVFTFEPPRKVFAKVLASVLARWPEALVEDLELRPEVVVPGSLFSVDQLPVESGVLLFVRDAAMARHMDDTAYTPMADGDGPIALHARLRRGVHFRIGELDELNVTDDPPSQFQIDPYAAWICSGAVFEMTLVTPGDPEMHPFSKWAFESVREACGGTGMLRTRYDP